MRSRWTSVAFVLGCVGSFSAMSPQDTQPPAAQLMTLAMNAGVKLPIGIVAAGANSALAVLNMGSGPQTVIIDTDGGCAHLSKQSLGDVASMYLSFGPKGEPPNSTAGARMLILTDPIEVCRITNSLAVSKAKAVPTQR